MGCKQFFYYDCLYNFDIKVYKKRTSENLKNYANILYGYITLFMDFERELG